MIFTKVKKMFSLVMSAVLCLQVFAVDMCCHATRNNKVDILYATDDGYFFPTLVSMQSAIDNMGQNTFYNFHVMVDGKFSNTNKLNEFATKNNDKCSIEIHNMKNDFEDCWTNYWPPSMYYRLKAASVLTNVDKCIYIDGDTLVMGDLYELFNTDLGNSYIGGVLDASVGRWECKNYINSGVALLNLQKIRNDDKEADLMQHVTDNNDNRSYIYPDQDIWNVVFNGSVKPLPLRYNFMTNFFMYEFNGEGSGSGSGNGLSMIGNLENSFRNINVSIQNRNQRDYLVINSISSGYPVIVHFITNKPWKDNCNVAKEGENWETFELLYKKWHEIAGKVQYEYNININKSVNSGSKSNIKWIIGGTALGVVATAGAIFGVKKLYDYNKKTVQDNPQNNKKVVKNEKVNEKIRVAA